MIMVNKKPNPEVFQLMIKASRKLKKLGAKERIEEYKNKVLGCENLCDALKLTKEYVKI